MQTVFFSRRDLPDNIQEVSAVEFTIKWDVAYDEGEHTVVDAHGYDELSELLLQRIEKLLKEKGGDLARIVQSSVRHNTKYEPYVSETIGDYSAILYKRL